MFMHFNWNEWNIVRNRSVCFIIIINQQTDKMLIVCMLVKHIFSESTNLLFNFDFCKRTTESTYISYSTNNITNSFAISFIGGRNFVCIFVCTFACVLIEIHEIHERVSAQSSIEMWMKWNKKIFKCSIHKESDSFVQFFG